MNTRNAVVSIGIILIVIFLAFVFYSKSQWHLLTTKVEPVTTENNTNNTIGSVGNVRLIVLKHNESGFCNNLFDDDADNLTDCADSECFNEAWCTNETV